MVQRSVLYVPPEEAERRIRAIFEECREVPGGEFRERAFQDLLVADKKANHAKWASRRRRFQRRIEREFVICFSLKPIEKNWSFPDFCAWVSERSGKDSVNLRLAEQNRRDLVGPVGCMAVPIGFGAFFLVTRQLLLGLIGLVLVSATVLIAGFVWTGFVQNEVILRRRRAASKARPRRR